MNHGSLYSGLGGLDWAVESALGCRTLWQLDQVNEKVRARHWPDSLQVVADVAMVDPADLPRVDVLSGSFACQDLSVAGKGAGLIDGSRSGPTYRHLLRFAGARLTDDGFERDDRRKWLPEIVVMENVPALLSKWRAVLEEDWHRLGYTLTWVKARALDAGHPHLRARVFVVAQRGGCGGGVLDAPRDRMWTPERGERRLRELAKGINGNGMSEPLAQQVRTWATPKSSDARSPGESSGDGARQGSDGLACQVRTWPTPMAGSTAPNGHGGSNRLLPDAVRPWPTRPSHGRMSVGGMNHERPAYTSESDSVRLLWGTGAAQEVSRRVLGVSLDVPSAEILHLAMRRARIAEGGALAERDREAADSAEEAILRGLQRNGTTRSAPQERRLVQQLAGELGDALRKLSHEASLGRGQGDASEVAAVPGVRQEEPPARALCEALPAMEEVGRPDHGEEQPAYAGAFGRRLNPAFCEALMGLPPGWTLPTGPRLHIDPEAPAVRGRYPADWDRSVYWPGFTWEPCRTIPDGPPCPGRPARIRAVGNAVCPQQGALALYTVLGIRP